MSIPQSNADNPYWPYYLKANPNPYLAPGASLPGYPGGTPSAAEAPDPNEIQLTPEEMQELREVRAQKTILAEQRLLEHIPVPIDWVKWVLIARMLRTPDGTQHLMNFATKWIESITHMVNALAQSSAGNIVAAWGHTHLIAQILEQNYMVRSGAAQGIILGLNPLTAAITVAEIFGSIAVPASLAFSGINPTALPKSLGIMKP